MSNLQGRGYTPLEVPIYEDLKWDMNQIISALEFIRQNLTTIVPEFPENLTLRLAKFNWINGADYPIIAIFSKEGRKFTEQETMVLDRLTIEFEPLEAYIKQVGLDTILLNAKKLRTPTWEYLKSGHYFPE